MTDIFKYSLGGLGITLVTNLVMTYFNFFLTDIFGITTFAVAGIMLVSRIVDAITDPLMGIIADRTHSRWGKFRPWLMFFCTGFRSRNFCAFLFATDFRKYESYLCLCSVYFIFHYCNDCIHSIILR